MINNIKNKKGTIPIIIILVIAILVIFYLGYFRTGSLAYDSQAGCTLGSWHVSSYDTSKGFLYIDVNVQGNNQISGCLGTYDLIQNDRGGLNINNKEDCEYIFGSGWDENNKICILSNDHWFDDKTSTSNVICSHTDKFNFPDPVLYDPSFNGFKVNFNVAGYKGDQIACAGQIIVKYPPKGFNPDDPNNADTRIDNPNFIDQIINFFKGLWQSIVSIFTI